MKIKEELINADCFIGMATLKFKDIATQYDLEPKNFCCAYQEIKLKRIANAFNCDLQDTIDFLINYMSEIYADYLINNIDAIAVVIGGRDYRCFDDLKHVAWLVKDNLLFPKWEKLIDYMCKTGTASYETRVF